MGRAVVDGGREGGECHCSLVSWCEHHELLADGRTAHLSKLSVGVNGNITGTRVYSDANGVPATHADLLIFTPNPGTPNPPEAWRVDYVRQLACL